MIRFNLYLFIVLSSLLGLDQIDVIDADTLKPASSYSLDTSPENDFGDTDTPDLFILSPTVVHSASQLVILDDTLSQHIRFDLREIAEHQIRGPPQLS